MSSTMTDSARSAENKAEQIEDLDEAARKAASQIWRTGLILSNKYKEDEELRSVIDKVQDMALVITPDLKKKFPQQLEDEDVDDKAAIGSKTGFQRLLAKGWFNTVRPEYSAFLREDASLFQRMDADEEDDAVGARIFRKLRLSAKWKSLSDKERGLIFKALLQINAYCRVASDVDLDEV